MTTPGGAGTPRKACHNFPLVLGAPASNHGVGAPKLQGSDPSLCPSPMLQGVSYVQIALVYIRNIIPAEAPLPRRRSWAVWDGAMPNFACTEFSEVRRLTQTWSTRRLRAGSVP